MSRSLDGLRAWVAGSGRATPAPLREGVWVVGGGKGGVGTSTVAGLLAAASGFSGTRTLLVEGDPGGLPLLFGLGGERAGVPDLVRAGVEPRDLLLPITPNLDLLPAGRWGDPFSRDVPEREILFRRVAELYEEYGLVVVDGGNRAASVLAACEAGTERVWLVTRRDRMAAAGAYALFKALHLRFPELPVALLPNGVVPNGADAGREDPAVDSVAEATLRFLGRELEVGPAVPADPELSQAMAAGVSLVEAGAGPAFSALLPLLRLAHPSPS